MKKIHQEPELGLIANLRSLTLQGEDYIWRTAQAALTAIANRDKEIEDLVSNLSDACRELDQLRKELREERNK